MFILKAICKKKSYFQVQLTDLGDHGRMKAAVLSAVVEEPREESGPVTPLALSMEGQTVWVSLLNEKLAILGNVSIYAEKWLLYL